MVIENYFQVYCVTNPMGFVSNYLKVHNIDGEYRSILIGWTQYWPLGDWSEATHPDQSQGGSEEAREQ